MAEAAQSASELTVDALFKKIDVNNNGQISKGEMFKAMTGSLKAEVEKKMGKNFLYHWKDYQDLDKTDGKELTEEQKALASTTLDLKEFSIWVEDCKRNMICAQIFKKLAGDAGTCTRSSLVKDMHERKDVYNKLFGCGLVDDTWPDKEDAKEAAASGESGDARLNHKIDIAEFTEWIKERLDFLMRTLSVEELFKKIDSNNNNQISKGEMFKALMGDLKAELEMKMGKNFLFHWKDFQALDKMNGKEEFTAEEQAIADKTLDLKEFTIWVEDCRRNMLCAQFFKEYSVVDGKERSAVDGAWKRSTLVADMKDRKEQYNKAFGCELVTEEWPSKEDASDAAASGGASNEKLKKKIDIAEYTEWIKARMNSLEK